MKNLEENSNSAEITEIFWANSQIFKKNLISILGILGFFFIQSSLLKKPFSGGSLGEQFSL